MKRKLLRGGAALGVLSAATFAVRFGTNLIFARLLVPEAFGTYALALAYSEVLALCYACSFPVSLLQLSDEEAPRLLQTVMRSNAKLSVGVIAVIAGSTLALHRFASADLAWSFCVLAAAQVLLSFGGILEAQLHRDHEYAQAGNRRFAATVVGILVALGVCLVWPSAVSLALRDLVTATGMLGVMSLTLMRMRISIWGPPDDTAAKAAWSLGKAFYFNRIVEVLRARMDVFIVGALLGRETLGFYNRAIFLAGLPGALVSPLTNIVAMRTLSQLKDDKKRSRRGLLLGQAGVMRFLLPFALGAAVAPAQVVRIALGPGWEASAELLPYLAIWLAVAPLSENLRVYLMTQRRWWAVRAGLLLASGILATAAYALSTRGAAGVAIATSAAALGSFGAYALMAKVDVGKVLEVYGKPLAVGLALLAIGFGLKTLEVLPPLIVALLVAATYGGALLHLDRHRVRELRGST